MPIYTKCVNFISKPVNYVTPAKIYALNLMHFCNRFAGSATLCRYYCQKRIRQMCKYAEFFRAFPYKLKIIKYFPANNKLILEIRRSVCYYIRAVEN